MRSSSETAESGESRSFGKEGPPTSGVRGTDGEVCIELACVRAGVLRRAGSIAGLGAWGVWVIDGEVCIELACVRAGVLRRAKSKRSASRRTSSAVRTWLETLSISYEKQS